MLESVQSGILHILTISLSFEYREVLLPQERQRVTTHTQAHTAEKKGRLLLLDYTRNRPAIAPIANVWIHIYGDRVTRHLRPAGPATLRSFVRPHPGPIPYVLRLLLPISQGDRAERRNHTDPSRLTLNTFLTPQKWCSGSAVAGVRQPDQTPPNIVAICIHAACTGGVMNPPAMSEMPMMNAPTSVERR
jgi:hypothetical protein